MSPTNKISIVVPVYNVINEVERCVESILTQTYVNIEVILVDDGSTDGSGAVCDSLAFEDSRIIVIHKENGGLSSARNAGMEKATGTWLMFIDSDDAIFSDACEIFIEVALKYDPDIVIGDAVHEMLNTQEFMCHPSIPANSLMSNVDFINKAIKNNEFYAPTWMNMYKAAFFRRHNLIFAEGLLHEDMEMLPKLFLAASKVVCTGKVFYRYIDRSSSIMNNSNKETRKSAMRFIYGQWKNIFNDVDDYELKANLDGFLAKCYLHTVRELDCGSLDIDGIDGSFLFRVGLNAKEKLKALLYMGNPKLLVLIGGRN